jgi:hypothetical protein
MSKNRHQPPSQFGIDEDDDAIDYSESTVVNVTDEIVSFTVATTPGSKARRYRLAPYGKNGDRINLQDGYAKPYPGAGRYMCPPIVERRTMRHVYPGSEERLPMVVHEDRAAEVRAKWLAAVKKGAEKAKQKPITVALEVNPHGEPVRATVKTPPLIGEVVGQDEMEAPHPDDVDALDEAPIASAPPAPVAAVSPVQAAAANAGKAKGK